MFDYFLPIHILFPDHFHFPSQKPNNDDLGNIYNGNIQGDSYYDCQYQPP